ncbi:polysaccharide lyase family 7 protein [Melittangium boletus]|uniref:Alginate lyase n=1 Tax=Melittangium boletus DSM 14713 TaxID=1294270 RepID=A0A250IBP1_9BACT|nr:polysaccharide lyase family 7 protein [Melittangium boletus]ATB28376.1 hypothetical protein MEBOL_001822 [Melittangium boletus DSM 14713]
MNDRLGRALRSLVSPWLLPALMLSACGSGSVPPEEALDLSSISGTLLGTISNPGFESGKTSWGDEASFEISTSDSHSGSSSAKLSASGMRIQQTLSVDPHTTYTLSAWILGRGTVGAKSQSTVLGSKGINASAWTQVSVSFNSGDATSVTLYGAYNAGIGRFDDFTLTASGTTPPPPIDAGTPSGNATFPSDVLELDNWKITLPIGDEESPDEISQPALDTYSHSTYFHLNSTKDGVVFRAHAGGVTTSGSGYPRSELREMKGSAKAAWSSSSGKHTLFIDQKITHLPDVKKHIVVGQIHDDSDDVIVFRLEGSKLFIDLNGADGPTLTSNYVLGTRFTVKFEVSNNVVKCYYNGVWKFDYPATFSGAYFKAGAYVQSSCTGEKKVPNESCAAYGENVIYDLKVTHQ